MEKGYRGWLRWVGVGVVAARIGITAGAWTLSGTNQPGEGRLFTLSVAANVTNLSLAVNNTTNAFSQLYLRAGPTASTNEYDFALRLAAPGAALNLELPELRPDTEYALWVQTPTNVPAAHAFAVTVTTNRTDVRRSSMPVSKPLTFGPAGVGGVLNPGETNFFQVDIPTNLPAWRLVLAGTGTADPDLALQRGSLPGTQALKTSTGRNLDTLSLTAAESLAGTYFVSVAVPPTDPGNATYTLRAEILPMVALEWDPGFGPEPETVFTNQSTLGGDYFFTLVTTNTLSGVWRTRLHVTAGDANLFLRKGSLPSEGAKDHASARAGSDGVALVQPGQCASGETWYFMVLAQPGAAWSLVSGSAYVPFLPSPDAGTAGGTNGVIAPEGMNFYRTVAGASTLAWRLGLNGRTNHVLVHRDRAAHPASNPKPDWNLPGHLLLVPPYLRSGGDYFVSILGTPGEAFVLDSQAQPVTDLPFESVATVTATNQGHVTYRVAVPVEQVGWQVDLQATAGDPHLAIRDAFVGNEFLNTAYLELTNQRPHTITLVPPTLRDSAFYVTVYGVPPFAATLGNRRPSSRYVPYRFEVTNSEPAATGWRFYGVTNTDEQTASLGWELVLRDQAPGTELALRRNRAPSGWHWRSNVVQSTVGAALVRTEADFTSTNGFLQRPQHAADIWYVGVRNPLQPPGPFVLTGRDIPVPELPLGSPFARVPLRDDPAGFIRYFRVTVPPDALGLEARFDRVTNGAPRLAVGRDLLPVSASSRLAGGATWSSPNTATNWPSGAQVYFESDWTAFTTAANGTNQTGHHFFAGRGNPLVPGTYHLGVFTAAGTTNPLAAELLVRGLFAGTNVVELPFAGGQADSGDLAAHETAWYRVDVPPNQPSWKLRVQMPTNQEAMLVVRHLGVANFGAGQNAPTNGVGTKLRKGGDEHFVLLPASPATNLLPGVYHLGLISEGQGPAGTRAGSNTCALTVTSDGPLPVLELGELDPFGLTALNQAAAQAGGEIQGFRFRVLEGTPALEVRLKDRTGNPRMVLRADRQLALLPDPYGFSGGATATWSGDAFIRVPSPVPGEYTLLVQAAGLSGRYPDARYTLEVRAQETRMLGFDAGLWPVTNQVASGWEYFRVTVPTNALGWDLRLTNVTRGEPRLVVCRERIPVNLTTRTATGGSWTPFLATNWPAGFQIAPDKDWTGYTQSALGTNEVGQVLMVAAGNPLEPGNYIVGVTGGGTPSPTNSLAYELLSRGIGPDLAIPVQPVEFAGGVGSSPDLPPREAAYFRVTIPTNTLSWQVRMKAVTGESLLAVRRGGLPNFGATMSTLVTNLAGCLLQRTNDEHFVLLPFQPAGHLLAGDYYFGVVSEGRQPSGSRIGAGTVAAELHSRGLLVPEELGRLDTWAGEEIWQGGDLDGGQIAAYHFEVLPGTVAVVVRLDHRVGNPVLTLRSGSAIPRSSEVYGRQGGWAEDWKDPREDSEYVQIPGTLGGEYQLVVQAGPVAGKYVPASYQLRIYSLVTGTHPLPFDGPGYLVRGHTSREWVFFSVDVPPEALGWDLRLTGVSGSNPAMVLCRDDYPRTLGSTFPWAAATDWPLGGQVLPGLDWTGYRTNANQVLAENKIFAAGLGYPVGPGRYVVGVTSSDPKAEADMAYTIVSRGIGPGYSIPVRPLTAEPGSGTVTNLPPQEAAYFSVDVPEETPAWKLRLRTQRGDAMLAVRRGGIPNVGAVSNLVAAALGGGHKVQKSGDEHLYFGPWTNGTDVVAAGRYYVAVVGEGESPNPALGVSGTGSSDCRIEYVLPTAPVDLGLVVPGGNDRLHTNSLAGGETATYAFTLPGGSLGLEVKLEAAAGRPLLRLRNDSHLPLDAGTYGQDGVFKGFWEGTNRIALVSPTGGVYQLSIFAGATNLTYPPLDYVLRVHAESPVSVLSFDAGREAITNQPSDLWKTYLVEVPPQAVGWDLRLTDVREGDPRLVICRDTVPVDARSRDELYAMTNWPSGWQLAPTLDWTGRNEAGGASSTGRVFQAGVGNPLAPGLYYVSITNAGPRAATYSILSRGIGPGLSIPVLDLPFANGLDSRTLDPREGSWYRVNVPSNSPAWKLRLTPESGEALLVAQKDALPHIRAHVTNRVDRPQGGKLLRKLGAEHLLSLPLGGTNTVLPAGTYYVGVVSEGNAPTNNLARIGTNPVPYAVWSEGARAPVPLGTVTDTDLVAPVSLGGGESGTWQFQVAEGTRAVEVWLPRTSGVPVMTLTTGDSVPGVTNSYGVDGGAAHRWASGSVITLPNPEPTTYSLTVQAGMTAGLYPDAAFDVRVRALPMTELSFDPVLAGPGPASSASGTIEEDHRAYFRVEVPAWLAGEPVIGWRLSLSSTHGAPAMRVRKHILPDDSGAPGTSAYVLRQAVFVPEFLSPGTWYVEVKAGGFTTFTITSQALRLDRPAWVMPEPGGPVTTPGMPAGGSAFGDTGFAPDGQPVPGLYVDLEQDSYHYYAVEVPARNDGLLRTELIAYNGDPNLYLRAGAPPTIAGIPVFDRALTNAVGTEYGNWVPLDNKTEARLTPGRWYLAVHAAGGANVRYRLKTGRGDFTPLPFNPGGPAGEQILTAGDWHYYRVALPVDLTEGCDVTFNRVAGEVSLHVRDTVPPGLGTRATQFITWKDDARNHGPYPESFGPGTHRLTLPPLRPGTPYYLGVRASTDARFTLAVAPWGAVVPLDGLIPFANGEAGGPLPAFGFRRYRIDTPPDARRFKLTALNPAAVRLHLDQGSLPTVTSSDHWTSSGANASLERQLYASSWPWLPGHRYFLTVTNTSRDPQTFSLVFDGRDCATDDYDRDGLPDCWEIDWFGSIYTYGPDSDPDRDGLTNLAEFQAGGDPTSARGRLALAGLAIDVEGRPVLEVEGDLGRSCRVLTSTTLIAPDWTEVASFIQSEPVQKVTLPLSEAGQPFRFYRVVSP